MCKTSWFFLCICTVRNKVTTTTTTATATATTTTTTSTRKRYIFITFPYSSNARKDFKITWSFYTKLQAMYPNVFKDRLMCSYKRNNILADYLVSAKFK